MTGEGSLVTVGGVPLHPLLVHAVVVLLPLAALGAVLMAIRPAARRRYGSAVLVLTAVAVISVPITQRTGEDLRAFKIGSGPDPLVDKHVALGQALLPYALAFGLTVVMLVIAGRLADRERAVSAEPGPDGTTVSATKTWRRIAVLISVLVVVTAVAATVQVVLIGHSGAAAVWSGMAAS